MSGIVKAEWLKLHKRPAIRSIVAIWLALVLLLGYLLPYLVFKNPPPGRVGARFASAAAMTAHPTTFLHVSTPTKATHRRRELRCRGARQCRLGTVQRDL